MQAKLSKEERLEAEKQCVEEVDINYNIILESSRTLKLSDDPKYKQFLHCFYKKQGFQSEDGEIQFNKISELLQEDGTDPEKLLGPCRSIRAPSEDMPFLVLKCIIVNILSDNTS